MVALPEGFGPTREAEPLADGTWRVTVTPPPWSGFAASTIILNGDQYRRYLSWMGDGGLMIQTALPDLSEAEREILLTGIGPQEWDAEFADDDTDDA